MGLGRLKGAQAHGRREFIPDLSRHLALCVTVRNMGHGSKPGHATWGSESLCRGFQASWMDLTPTAARRLPQARTAPWELPSPPRYSRARRGTPPFPREPGAVFLPSPYALPRRPPHAGCSSQRSAKLIKTTFPICPVWSFF